VAADSWLAMMDRLLTLGNDCAEEIACMKENINLLIDIYYDALDAPKKGGRRVSFLISSELDEMNYGLYLL
jgi:RNA-dependent RNA polymerase